MSIPRIAKAIEYIDDDLVSGAVTYTRTKKANSWLKWGAIAACMCLVVVGAFMAGRSSNVFQPIQRPISAYIQEDVSIATVYHTGQGKTAELIIEGEALESLRVWTNNLEYALTADNGKEKPENIETAEIFKIVLEEGDYPGFSYFVCGENNCYLWIEGYWYAVINPSNPPV